MLGWITSSRVANIERLTAHSPIQRPVALPKHAPPETTYPTLKRRRRPEERPPYPSLVLTLLTAVALAAITYALL